jgi:phytoene/squalene synthetase
MAEANEAYEQGNVQRLKEILTEYETSPESVRGVGVAADLVRVIRNIAQVKKRLAQIDRELREVGSSDIAELKAKADERQKQRRDLLAEMAERVREQIAMARRRLEEMPPN